MRKKCFQLLCLLPATLMAQTSSVSLQTVSNYNQWGWSAIVMQNGTITIATVPAIGARVMEYDLGGLPSVMVNPSLLGETYTPAENNNWYNFGGYKTWPSPQSKWDDGGWPPPPTLDYGAYGVTDTTRTYDSVSVGVASQTEQWYTPGIQFVRKATIYDGTSRVKMEQTIVNNGAVDLNWGVWSIIQSIVNHPGENDYENFWTYFPINPNSVFGSSGVAPQGSSEAWKGEIAPGIYGVQFSPDNQKIFADPDRGWIAYADVSDTVIFARTFPVYEGMDYPDGGARVSVYVSSPGSSSAPAYMEVEVKGPLVDLAANGGKYTFTENWWAARVKGPILDVDSVGAISAKLVYNKSSQSFTADYGTFYSGTASIVFLDAQGNVISEGRQHSITPLEEFQLQETIAIPDGTNSVEVHVHDGSGVLVGILEKENISLVLKVVNTQPVISGYRLMSGYPNPFNGGTMITVSCPVISQGSLRIYDLLGRQVAILARGQFSTGEHRYTWNPTNLAGGVYVARLAIGGIQLSQKIIYLP